MLGLGGFGDFGCVHVVRVIESQAPLRLRSTHTQDNQPCREIGRGKSGLANEGENKSPKGDGKPTESQRLRSEIKFNLVCAFISAPHKVFANAEQISTSLTVITNFL